MVVTGSRVPPDTQLTSGPAEGSMIADSRPALEFTGSDDVLQPSQLTYECQVDAGAWQQCTSPKEVAVTDGRHTFSVRAVDDMLNVDQSPAKRTWTSDTTGPSKPVIRGRRSVREGRRVVLRFSATDELAGGVTFYCYVKRRPFRRCSAVYRTRKLRRGRNIGLVYAVDRLGNRSKLAAFIIRVKRAQR